MKAICVTLCLSLLVSGCYSSVPLVKNESAQDDQDVRFFLRDSSTIESREDDHHRVAAGYKVDGIRFNEGEEERDFSGVIPDQDISRIEVIEAKNVPLIVAGIVIINAAALIIYFAPGNRIKVF